MSVLFLPKCLRVCGSGTYGNEDKGLKGPTDGRTRKLRCHGHFGRALPQKSRGTLILLWLSPLWEVKRNLDGGVTEKGVEVTWKWVPKVLLGE